jgi:hypothetical protein
MHPMAKTAAGMEKAIKDPRSATVCLAKANSSFDIGSPLRSLPKTFLKLPISSLNGVGSRPKSRFTKAKTQAANTNSAAPASIAR